MTAIKKELRELTRRMGMNETENLRTEMLREWCSYCLSADLNDEIKYFGAGLISLAASENLETALELRNDCAVVKNSNYTLRVQKQRSKSA